MLERRSNAVSGWVNFPVDDPRWRNTREGGMVVKAVVCDDREFDDPLRFEKCTGAQVVDLLNEVLVGDDRAPPPVAAGGYDTPEGGQQWLQAFADWESRHFPRLHDKGVNGLERYLSRGYLAVLVLGSTGWSGSDVERHELWHCRFEDLTPDGQALYRQLEALYPGATVHLLTFLDT